MHNVYDTLKLTVKVGRHISMCAASHIYTIYPEGNNLNLQSLSNVIHKYFWSPSSWNKPLDLIKTSMNVGTHIFCVKPATCTQNGVLECHFFKECRIRSWPNAQ